jgi:hypothetical protein
VVSARVVDGIDGSPVAGATVTLGLGDTTHDRLADGDGVVSHTVPIDQPAGPAAVTASFAGDDRYDAASATATIDVIAEDAALAWRGSSVVLGAEVLLRVEVTEADDGHTGEISNAAVTFWVYDDPACTGAVSMVGPVPVTPGAVAGTGVAEAAATGQSGAQCVRATLTAPDDPVSPNGFYEASPVEALVEVIADGHVTGGGRLDGSDDRLSAGFVAQVHDGTLSGHLEVVEHGQGPAVVMVRSTNLTSLSVTDLDGTRLAPWLVVIRGDGERRAGSGWEPVSFEVVVIDNGSRGDRILVLVGGQPVAPTDGPVEPQPLTGGQVVVHLARRIQG